MTITSDRDPRRQSRAPADPQYRHRWLILLVVLVAQVMILIDATVINVALPSAQRALHFSDADRQWVITAYVLAFGSLLPLGGRMADKWGRKSMFVFGLVGFGIFSALAGAAPDTAVLFIARTMQGVFAAALAPAALSVIPVTFTDPHERNRAFAIFGAVAGSAGAVGLLFGGVLTSYASWRWTMFVNVPFAVVAIIGALTLMTKSADPRKPKLDIPGAVLASGGLFFIVFGAGKAETAGWSAAITIASFVVGAVLLCGFVIAERLSSYPLVPLRVPGDRNRGAAYLALALGSAGSYSALLFLTYYFQGVLGYSPVKTGLAFLPGPLSIVVAATLTQSVLLQRFKVRTIMFAGLTVSGAGASLLAGAGIHSGYASWDLPGLALIGVGLGSALVVSIALGQDGVDPMDAGAAGGMNNVSQQIGVALGIGLISTIVATATANFLHSHPRSAGAAAESTLHGFRAGYWWGAGVFFAAAVISSLLVRSKTSMAPPPAATLGDEASDGSLLVGSGA